MTESKTLDEINQAIAAFSEKIKSVKEQPEKIESAFRSAAVLTAGAEGGATLGPLGAVIGVAYGTVAHDDFSGKLQAHKEEIKAGIATLLDKLSNTISAMEAPSAFSTTADKWSDIKATIGGAQNAELVKGGLTGYWEGTAAERYEESRKLQDTAIESMKTACETMSTNLSDIASSAWEYYSNLTEKLVDFLAKFATALTKISSGAETPWGISDAIDLLGSTITTVTNIANSYVKVLLNQSKAVRGIESSINNGKGIYRDHWPKSTAGYFDTNSPGGGWEPK